MKKSFFLFIIILITSQSCQKLLKDDPQNVFQLKTKEDIWIALGGLYSKLSTTQINEGSLPLLGNGDDVINVSAGTNSIQRVYNILYQVIACANDILKKADGIKKTNEVKNLLGEIYFIRGWCYFQLARCFGQIPLVYNTDVNYSIPKPSYIDVYDSIQHDLQTAINYLPGSFDESRIKYMTPTRGTAKALLAEVLLTRGGYPVKDQNGYSDAWKMAKDVIDSASVFNFDLLPDFANLWDGRHELNQEGEFLLFYLITDWSKPDSFSEQLKFKNVVKMNWQLYGGGYTGVTFFNNFPKQYRKDKTYETYQIIVSYSPYKKDTSYYNLINSTTGMPQKKYYSAVDSIGYHQDGADFNGNNSYTGHIIYLLRYAHTLLTYAEAKARDGQLDATAYEAVNKVKRRANHLDINTPSVYDLQQGLSTEAFIDSVIWERAWEFCGEPGNRWFDILRTEQMNQLSKLTAPYDPFGFPVNSSTYFYEIPTAEKALLPNFK